MIASSPRFARDDGRIALADAEGGADARSRRTLLIGRLQTLEALGLAKRESGDTWRIAPDAERTLRAMGERGDIVRTMQRALGESDRPLVLHQDRAPAASIVGRIAGKGHESMRCRTAAIWSSTH